jgi:plastocyanin
MSMRRGFAVLAVVLALPAVAGGESQVPAVEVEAAGNPFTGGLAFKPPSVKAVPGQQVRWTNTDDSVPHTATENHQLWDLTGTYGLPGNYGFGPGESRQRRFEAGTHRYFCKVHPEAMKGVVAVPVALSVRKARRKIVAFWAAGAPKAGQVYDVQIKRGKGKWKSFRSGTRENMGRKQVEGKESTWRFRARLRKANDRSAATGWSPVAKVKL